MSASAPSALRLGLLGATVAVSCVNGTFYSPLFDPIFFYMGPVAETFFIPSSRARLYFTSVVIFLVTLALAGVPAALYERATGQTRSSPVSLFIWLLSAILLSAPTLLSMMQSD
jgi:hypothetical protein